MDVQADEAGAPSDPYATAVFQRPAATGRIPAVSGQPPASAQGQLFADAYPTYADTDRIPAVAPGAAGRRPGPARWLRVTVGVVAVVVVGAGVALALVETGVIGKTSPSGSTGAPTTHSSTPTTSQAPLITQVSTGADAATYAVDIAAYAVTVTTSTGSSWVSIGTNGKPPIYAGILAPSSSQREILLGPSQVSVGAGGTTVVVSSGRRSVTLTPPSAPFNYQFLPKG